MRRASTYSIDCALIAQQARAKGHVRPVGPGVACLYPRGTQQQKEDIDKIFRHNTNTNKQLSKLRTHKLCSLPTMTPP